MDTQEFVKEWEQRLKQEGRQEGEKTGRQEAAATIRPVLLRLYGFRFGAVPEHVRTRIETESDLTVLAAWTELIAREPQEIVDRALSPAPS